MKIAIDPLFPPPCDFSSKSGHKFGGNNIF